MTFSVQLIDRSKSEWQPPIEVGDWFMGIIELVTQYTIHVKWSDPQRNVSAILLGELSWVPPVKGVSDGYWERQQ